MFICETVALKYYTKQAVFPQNTEFVKKKKCRINNSLDCYLAEACMCLRVCICVYVCLHTHRSVMSKQEKIEKSYCIE